MNIYKNKAFEKHQNSRKSNSQWIYGTHAVTAALKNKNRSIHKIVSIQQITDTHLLSLIAKRPVEIQDKAWFISKFGNQAVHQGICLEATPIEYLSIDELISHPLFSEGATILALDQITDPQNVGTILRSAAVFGPVFVLLHEHSAPELTPSLIKAASGAVEIVPLVRVTNLAQSLEKIKDNGYWVVGLDERGEKPLSQIPFKNKIALVIGSEGNGIRPLTRKCCDVLSFIPGKSYFSTLNAAQAASVALYELIRENSDS